MKIQLSISLLASKRTASLARCLDSLLPLLGSVPSELIIVYTGTDERVRRVAECYTDQVISFAWCDDFSAARNVGLKKAKGEWFLYIDDDEWFEDVTEIRDFFLSGEYRRYSGGLYVVRNYLDWGGRRRSDYPAFRMAKRTPELAFQNPIHEQLWPIPGPWKHFQAYVHHYGYVRDVKAADEKASRNIPLLLEDMKRSPGNLKNYLQITKEYCSEGEWDKAEEYCRKGRELWRRTREPEAKVWLEVYLALLVEKRKVRKREGAEELEKVLGEEKPCELARLLIFYYLVCIYAQLGEAKEALRCAGEYERILKYMEKHAYLWEKQGYGDVNKGMAKDPEKLTACRMDAVSCALKLGDGGQAERFLKLLPWDEDYRMRQYYPMLDTWAAAYGPRFRDILEKLSFESPWLMWQAGMRKREEGDAEAADGLLALCMADSEDMYLRRNMVRGALLDGTPLEGMAGAVDLDTWRFCLEGAVEEIPFAEMEKVEKAAEDMGEKVRLQRLWLRKLCLERKLMRGYLLNPELTDTLAEYARCICQYYREQYVEEMFGEERRGLLPKDCRFALLALEGLGKIGERQFAEAVRMFRGALHIYPQMTGTINEVLRLLGRELDSPPGAPGAEFEALGVKMKEALGAMLAGGQYAEAEAVVRQLMPLMPNDLELLRMRQRILREE